MPIYISKILVALCLLGLLSTKSFHIQQTPGEWRPLFNHQTLDGWKVGENSGSFTVQEGKIVANGPRAHLFYVGSVSDHKFKNFEFKADIMTTEGSNSGIYFHTRYQKSGWPSEGQEVQVNNSYEHDPRRTASLYAVDDIMQAPAKDNTWFTMYIKVAGRQVTVKVDDETLVEYTEPDSVARENSMLSSGTFALQAHDAGSTVFYKNIMVRPL